MVIRSISQLPRTDVVGDNDLVEVSRFYEDGKYISKSASISVISNKAYGDVYEKIVSDFSLTDDNESNIDVNGLKKRVDAISSDNVTLYGKKTFNDIPEINKDISDYGSVTAHSVPTIEYVNKRIFDRACYIADSYKVDADPGVDKDPPNVKDNDTFMHWHIDDQGTDTTQWMNPLAHNEKTDIDGIRCYQTGYLTIFGWLADNGDEILPQNAWIGLYGRIKNPDSSLASGINDPVWVLLQVQPWIRGQYSSQCQYVGFQLPVQKDLFLKIRTGFKVNGNGGGFQNGGNLRLALNQPNSFVGYIIRQEDD